MYARVEEVPYLRLRGAGQAYVRLKQYREQAVLCRALTGIALDAPVPADIAALAWSVLDHAELDVLLERLRFGPLTRSRCRALRSGSPLPAA